MSMRVDRNFLQVMLNGVNEFEVEILNLYPFFFCYLISIVMREQIIQKQKKVLKIALKRFLNLFCTLQKRSNPNTTFIS